MKKIWLQFFSFSFFACLSLLSFRTASASVFVNSAFLPTSTISGNAASNPTGIPQYATSTGTQYGSTFYQLVHINSVDITNGDFGMFGFIACTDQNGFTCVNANGYSLDGSLLLTNVTSTGVVGALSNQDVVLRFPSGVITGFTNDFVLVGYFGTNVAHPYSIWSNAFVVGTSTLNFLWGCSATNLHDAATCSPSFNPVSSISFQDPSNGATVQDFSSWQIGVTNDFTPTGTRQVFVKYWVSSTPIGHVAFDVGLLNPTPYETALVQVGKTNLLYDGTTTTYIAQALLTDTFGIVITSTTIAFNVNAAGGVLYPYNTLLSSSTLSLLGSATNTDCSNLPFIDTYFGAIPFLSSSSPQRVLCETGNLINGFLNKAKEFIASLVPVTINAFSNVFPLSTFVKVTQAINTAKNTTTTPDIIINVSSSLGAGHPRTFVILTATTTDWILAKTGFDYKMWVDYFFYAFTGMIVIMSAIMILHPNNNP